MANKGQQKTKETKKPKKDATTAKPLAHSPALLPVFAHLGLALLLGACAGLPDRNGHDMSLDPSGRDRVYSHCSNAIAEAGRSREALPRTSASRRRAIRITISAPCSTPGRPAIPRGLRSANSRSTRCGAFFSGPRCASRSPIFSSR